MIPPFKQNQFVVLAKKNGRGGYQRTPWFEFFVFFDFFAPWYRSREASSVKISYKSSKEKLVKCATEAARLHNVFVQSCTQIGRLRKYNRTHDHEIALMIMKLHWTFFTAYIIFMKLGTLVHHVHGYDMISETGTVDNFDVSLSSSFIRKKREKLFSSWWSSNWAKRRN